MSCWPHAWRRGYLRMCVPGGVPGTWLPPLTTLTYINIMHVVASIQKFMSQIHVSILVDQIASCIITSTYQGRTCMHTACTQPMHVPRWGLLWRRWECYCQPDPRSHPQCRTSQQTHEGHAQCQHCQTLRLHCIYMHVHVHVHAMEL